MDVNGAARVTDDTGGGGTEEVIAQSRFVRADDDAVDAVIGRVIYDGSVAVTLDDLGRDSGKAVGLRGQLGPRALEPFLEDIVVKIGRNRTLRST